MNNIEITYAPNYFDYHQAVYYALVMRRRTFFRILIALAGASLLCWISAYLQWMPLFMLPAYITLGYLLWAMFICISAEHGILKYAKTPDSILGRDMTLTFTREQLFIDTPYNKKKSSVRLDKLFCAFELSHIFLIYLDGEHSLLLPHRALSADQRTAVRSLLQDNLHDRFSTRFGLSSMLPRRSPLRK